MYSDQDGIASQFSQAKYESQRTVILSLTLFLSGIGIVSALLDGEYSRDALFAPFTWQIHRLLLWASLSLTFRHLSNLI